MSSSVFPWVHFYNNHQITILVINFISLLSFYNHNIVQHVILLFADTNHRVTKMLILWNCRKLDKLLTWKCTVCTVLVFYTLGLVQLGCLTLYSYVMTVSVPGFKPIYTIISTFRAFGIKSWQCQNMQNRLKIDIEHKRINY